MADVLAPPDPRIDALERSVAAIDARLAALEAQLSGAPARVEEDAAAISTREQEPTPAAVPALAPSEPADEESESFWDLSLIGRTFIILGGAYLLRAITQRDVVPEVLGMLAGLAYALFWIFAAYRAAAASPWKATFEAGIATSIGFAIAIESASRFHILGPGGAALIVLAITAAVLLLSVRRSILPLAWFGVVGSVTALSALALVTKSIVPPAAAIFLVGAAASWAASRAGFDYLHWVPSVQANLMFLAIPFVLGVTHESRTVAIWLLQNAMVMTAIALFVVIAIWKRTLMIFGFIYVAWLFAITIGAVGWLTRGVPEERLVLAIGTVVAAAFLWAAAVVGATRDDESGTRNYPAIVGTLLTIAGSFLLFPEEVASIGWAVAAAALGWVARPRLDRSFPLHAALFGSAAALASGLLPFIFSGVIEPAHGTPPTATPAAMITLALLTVSAAMMSVRRDPARFCMPRAILLGIAAAGWCAAIFGAIARLLPLLATEPGAAVSRTLLFSAFAVGLALVARSGAVADVKCLVNPFLAVIAIKLLVEDFRYGTPATLFVSLAAYGGALVLAARFRRRKKAQPVATA